MNSSRSIDQTINNAAFWAAVVMILAGITSVFFPLDAPAGTTPERLVWFSKHLDSFVIGWVIQMIAMLTLSGALAGTAWQVRSTSPVSAFVAGAALLAATIAFLMTKFIAIWSIPQMVISATAIQPDIATAEQSFQLLNPSLAYSLFSSFDYLGFWMYAVFGLLLAKPLFQLSLSAKIAAVSLGLYGILYHLLLFGVITRNIASADIEAFAVNAGFLLAIAVVAMAVFFRGQRATPAVVPAA